MNRITIAGNITSLKPDFYFPFLFVVLPLGAFYEAVVASHTCTFGNPSQQSFLNAFSTSLSFHS